MLWISEDRAKSPSRSSKINCESRTHNKFENSDTGSQKERDPTRLEGSTFKRLQRVHNSTVTFWSSGVLHRVNCSLRLYRFFDGPFTTR